VILMRYTKNALAVLLVTGLTSVALYVGVQLLAKGVNPSDAAASVLAAGQTYVCPASGCASATCHATTGAPPSAAGLPVAASRVESSSSGVSAASGSSAVTVCPRTGCAASTCHGATNSPPPAVGSAGANGGSLVANSGARAPTGRASGSGVTLTCPDTGCTASSCHSGHDSDGEESGAERARHKWRREHRSGREDGD
jgi:hypothetical protein